MMTKPMRNEKQIIESSTVYLCSADEMDIEKTFECGQCFRWNRDDKGVYSGVAMGYGASLFNRDENVYIRSCAPIGLWRNYFDLDRDYKTISETLRLSEYLSRCIDYGAGIRILRQEPWEALCSFIISQCNNIKRIKGIVERLCLDYGDKILFDGEQMYTFPTPQVLAGLNEEDLSSLRCGYRSEYVLSAARAVASGELDLNALISAPWEEAKKILMTLKGVGEKVANCVVLFGLHHMEAFPIDVWIKRALKEHFPPKFDPRTLGEYAGLAQQYIFYYIRSN